MKLFLSADIEGCAGVALSRETHNDEECYKKFAQEMTDEVIAACEAFHEAGVSEIVVKDGHGDATNINPLEMPSYVTLIRGKSGHPFNMMFGIDESFDGVAFLGYHAPGGDPDFAISHTSTGQSLYIELNGTRMSELLLNAYTATLYHLPLIFLSGDQKICRIAHETIPGIETVETKYGVGDATFCISRENVLYDIREKAARAVRKLSDPKEREKCLLTMPAHFQYDVHFKDWKRAYKMSFYPGVRQLDTFTDELTSDRWMDIVRAHYFMVY